MSRPPISPEKSNAGIITDPHTLQRVIPESKRPDGSIRKQHKVRPGYVPQEDAKLFRGSRQSQMNANALPKGHIMGWVPPSSPPAPLSRSAKKNARRKEKREEKKANAATDNVVRDSWEDEDEEEQPVVLQTLDTDLTNKGHSELVADKPNVFSPKALAADLHKLNVK